MSFKLLPPARRELKEAAHFYEGRIFNLGFEFLAEVRATIQRILAHPHAWQPLDQEMRRCRTHRFPYGIIYSVENGAVLVISVMHLHRHPDSWRKNLD